MRCIAAAVLALGLTCQPPPALAQTCSMSAAFTRSDERGTVRRQVEADAGGAALAFTDRLKVNTDGTRISYHQDDPWGSRLAINYLVNGLSSYPCADPEPNLEGRACSHPANTAIRPASP